MINLAEKRKVLAFPDGSTLQEKEVVVADLDNGYTRIANAIVDALCCTKLSDQEHRVLFAVIRKTYGYQHAMDWVANVQISSLTGMDKRHVSTTIKKLVSRNILRKNGKSIGVNPVISGWISKEEVTQTSDKEKSLKQGTKVTQIGKGIPQTGDKNTLNERTQKKILNTKETIKDTYVQNVRSSLPEVSNFVFINLPLKDGTAHQVTAEDLDYYKELYPMADVEQSLRSMLGWLNANTAKRKTKKGIKAFVTGWLNRENKNTVQHRQEVANNQAPDFHKCDLSWADDLGW